MSPAMRATVSSRAWSISFLRTRLGSFMMPRWTSIIRSAVLAAGIINFNKGSGGGHAFSRATSARVIRLSAAEANRVPLLLRIEHETVAKQKIHRRTNDDCQQVRCEIVKSQFAHQQSHRDKVPDNGNRSIADVELNQPDQRLHRPHSLPVRPGEALVPQKIVDHRHLDRQPGAQQIIEPEPRTKDR